MCSDATEQQLTDEFTAAETNYYGDEETVSKSLLDIRIAYCQDYEEILTEYKNNLKENFALNRRLKICFFIVCAIILLAECGFQAHIVYKVFDPTFTDESFNLILSSVVSLTGTFLTTFIILPKTIAKYLFNAKEQKDMKNIMKQMQKHFGQIKI